MRVEVDAVNTPLRINTLNADTAIGQRSTGGITLRDDDGSEQYEMGQLVEIIDDQQADKLVFSGVVDTSEESAKEPTDELEHKLALVDWHYLADKRLAAIAYDAGLLVGDVASDLVKQYLYEEGVVGRRDAPIFARASSAYKVDGTSVSTDAPRYYPVAANMLAPLQSIIDGATLSDPSFKGSLGAGGAISLDTGIFWQGTTSLKALADGSATFQSVSINIASSQFSANATYTFSAWLRSFTGTPTVRFYCQANDLIAGNASIGSVGSITLSTTWTRYSFTVTMPADLSPYSIIGMRVDTGGVAQAITWYMDALQIESGSSASDWTLGGGSACNGIRVEEGTTNLLSANQSSVETNTTGFSAAASALLTVGATLTRVTTEHWSGAAALQVVTTAVGAGQGAETTAVAASASTKYTAQSRIKGTAGKVVTLALRDFTNSVVGSVDVTLSGGWDRATITITTGGSAVTDLRMCVKSKNAEVLTFYLDGLQIEAKMHATQWQIGGTPRATETLKLPAQGCVSPLRGTIQFKALIDANARSQPTPNNGGNLFGIDKGPTPGNGGALNLFHSNNTANWVMNISSVQFPAFSDSCTPDGWHEFAIAWDKVSVLVYVDGILRATQNNPTLSSLAPFFYIGSNGVGADFCDTVYRDVRVSARKRTAAEIAADALLPDFLTLDQDACYLTSLNGALAASSHIADGTLLPDVIFNYCSNADALDALTRKAGPYWWQIDAYRQLWVQPFTAISAPWQLLTDGNGVTTDARRGSIRVKRAKPLYRNVQYVGGIKGRTSSQVEVKIGDGHATTFTVGYPIAEVPTVETKIGAGAFTAKTVGIKGVDTGKDFYWNGGDAVVTQDSGGVVLTSADQIRITYVGEFPLIVISEDTAEIIGQQTLEGGGTSGKVELITQDASLTSSAAAFNEAAALLKKFAQKATTLRFLTRRPGLAPGQILHVEIPRHHLDDDMLIESVKLTDQDGQIIWYDVTALLGPANTSWVQFFGSLARGANGSADVLQVGANTTLVLTADFTATSAASATFTATVYACPLFPWTLPVTLC